MATSVYSWSWIEMQYDKHYWKVMMNSVPLGVMTSGHRDDLGITVLEQGESIYAG